MRLIRKFFIYLFFILVAIFLFIYVYLQMQRPLYSGTIEIPDLNADVMVYFDDYGIPHIYSSDEEAAFCALGYIHAKERLFQMELIRRVSSGRLSEIFGNKTLEADKFFRMLGLGKRAEEAERIFMYNTDERWKKDVLAYIEGINQYIEKRRKRFEFLILGIPKEKFSVRDIYLIADYMAFDFQMAFKTDPLMSRIGKRFDDTYLNDLGIRNQYQAIDTGKFFSVDSMLTSLEDILPIKIWSGSNAWAVSAERSKSGKVLFENDTHVGLQQPAIWYEAHIECPGFSMYGSYLAGFPFPALGHNRQHAWGLTILENDELDFFAEQVNPQDSTLILINDKWEKIEAITETIKVKDSAEVSIVCRSTPHGPICSDVMREFSSVTSSPVSVCWTYLKFPVNLPEVTWRMCTSDSIDKFREAVSMIAAPGLNVIYADADNNIAWYTAAKFVKRKSGINPNVILDGSGANDWEGFYDFSFNPKAENPVRGVVLSANHAPSPDSLDWFPGYYAPPDRALRINQFFHSKKILSLSDMRTMNTDVVNIIAAQNAQLMIGKLRGVTKLASQIHERCVEILDRWNGSHDANEIAPVIYYKLLYHILHDAFVDEIGEKNFKIFLQTHVQKSSVNPILRNDSSKWWNNIHTKYVIESETKIIEGAFIKTINELIAQFGPDPDDWRWKKAHLFEIVHPVGTQKPFDKFLNIGPFGVSGGIETLNNQGFDLNGSGTYKVNLSPGLRRSIDFADPENALSIIPSGQSGNFMSSHYDDQTRMYINGNVRKEMMNKEEILKKYSSKMVFRQQR